MYTRRTSNIEKGSTPEGSKLGCEHERQVDTSRTICYGLTWTPSRDEKLSTNDTSYRSLSPTPQTLNSIRINDNRTERSFSKPYELNQPKDLSKFISTRTATAIDTYKDLESFDCWLSGEKFFQTPPKNYNEENDIYDIPTRDKNDDENIGERRKDKEYHLENVSLDFSEIPLRKAYDSDKTLIHNMEDLRSTKGTNDYGDRINKIQRSSVFPRDHVEEKPIKINANNPSNPWNVLDSISTLGSTNVHNHIYLSSGCLDRYFDIPLSKFLKVSRRNARVRCIRRRILKRPKRSRSAACRISSMIEIDRVNSTSSKEQKGRASLKKKNVFDVLADIDAELSTNLKFDEKIREKLPPCMPIDTIFMSEIKQVLNEVARRFKDYIQKDRDEVTAKMDNNLLRTFHNLLAILKRLKYILSNEDQQQYASMLQQRDFQKIKSLRNDAKRILSDPLLSYRTTTTEKLLNDILVMTNEICAIEDNKENIRKSKIRKTNDQDSVKKQPISKLDGKASPVKNTKRFSMRKENQVDTQMNLLSKAQPTVSIGKLKTSTKDLDGYRDRMKMKEIGDQRDRVLKENEDRVERQNFVTTRRSVHNMWNNFGNRINTGTTLENPKVIKDRKNNNATRGKESTSTSPINGDTRRKRRNSNNAPLPVWKPGGAYKSFNSTTTLHAEPINRRTLHVPDKENSDVMRSIPVKHVNPSEPTASRENILKENRKNENFRDKRVSKLCKLLVQTKMRKGSKNDFNVLSETRSSTTNTPSEVPVSDTSGAKIGVKSSEINLFRQSSVSKPRPGIEPPNRLISNNKNQLNNFQGNTGSVLEATVQSLPSTINIIDKLEPNEAPSNFAIKLNEKNNIENESVLNQKNLKEFITLDSKKSSIILPNDENMSQNTQSPETADNELIKNKCYDYTNSMSSNPQKSPVTSLNSNNAHYNVDYDLRSESRPSFILLEDASCNAEFSSTSNSTMMVPSSKCFQVSLSSSSSRTDLNYDQPYGKTELIDATHKIEKDSLESSTDNESNYQTALGFDPLRQKKKHEISLNSLKNCLYELGCDKDLIKKVEKKYQMGNQSDRQKSLRKSNETSRSNLSESITSATRSPVVNVSINVESDNLSSKRYEFKSDDNRSMESIDSSDYSTNSFAEKLDETTLEMKQSKSSQTILNFKEFCDACTDVEDMKSEYSTYVDAMISCQSVDLKTLPKDVGTQIFTEDQLILSSQRMVETQANLQSFFTKGEEEKNIVSIKNEIEDQRVETNDSKSEKPDYENESNKSRHDTSNNSHRYSTWVDAMVFCQDVGLKTLSRDASTQIFVEDQSILSPRRMVETQAGLPRRMVETQAGLPQRMVETQAGLPQRMVETQASLPRQMVETQANLQFSSTEREEKNDTVLIKDKIEGQHMEINVSKLEQLDYENESNKCQHDGNSKNDHEKSSEGLLNSEDRCVTIDKSPFSQCLINHLEDIKEQLQNVDAQLNKLYEPTKETNDAFSQASAIKSFNSKSIGISTTSMFSEVPKESLEKFDKDFIQTKENFISNDIVNAFYRIEQYSSNWKEALRIYKEYSNVKSFKEYDEGVSTCSSSIDEVINVSKMAQFVKDDIPTSCELVNKDSGLGKSSDLLNECTDFSDELDESKSLSSFGLEELYEEEMKKTISRKSSRDSVFFETQDETNKVVNSIDTKDRSSEMMKHSERIYSSKENKEEGDAYDPQEFVLSKEALLLLTYLTICAFVFCCLKFTMTCESLIL